MRQEPEPVAHSLELDDEINLHRKGWCAQFIGWSIFYCILLLAAAGLFGTGPLSYVRQTGNSMTIEYERFLRFESESTMVLRFGDVADTAHITIPGKYNDYIDILRITPMPLSNRTIRGNTTYTFLAKNGLDVHVTIMAKKPGYFKGAVLLNNEKIPLTHLIYP